MPRPRRNARCILWFSVLYWSLETVNPYLPKNKSNPFYPSVHFPVSRSVKRILRRYPAGSTARSRRWQTMYGDMNLSSGKVFHRSASISTDNSNRGWTLHPRLLTRIISASERCWISCTKIWPTVYRWKKSRPRRLHANGHARNALGKGLRYPRSKYL